MSKLSDGPKPSQTKFVKITRQIRDFPAPVYRLSSDGKKWAALCRQRMALADYLSTFADGDGTRIEAGIRRIAKKLSCSRATAVRRLEDLRIIGCLRNDTDRQGKQITAKTGTYRRAMILEPLARAFQAIEQGESAFAHPDARGTCKRRRGRPSASQIENSDTGVRNPSAKTQIDDFENSDSSTENSDRQLENSNRGTSWPDRHLTVTDRHYKPTLSSSEVFTSDQEKENVWLTVAANYIAERIEHLPKGKSLPAISVRDHLRALAYNRGRSLSYEAAERITREAIRRFPDVRFRWPAYQAKAV